MRDSNRVSNIQIQATTMSINCINFRISCVKRASIYACRTPFKKLENYFCVNVVLLFVCFAGIAARDQLIGEHELVIGMQNLSTFG